MDSNLEVAGIAILVGDNLSKCYSRDVVVAHVGFETTHV